MKLVATCVFSNRAFKGDEDDEGANDDEEFTVGAEVDEGLVIQPRWPTRVFAALCLRKIIEGDYTKRNVAIFGDLYFIELIFKQFGNFPFGYFWG